MFLLFYLRASSLSFYSSGSWLKIIRKTDASSYSTCLGAPRGQRKRLLLLPLLLALTGAASSLSVTFHDFSGIHWRPQ